MRIFLKFDPRGLFGLVGIAIALWFLIFIFLFDLHNSSSTMNVIIPLSGQEGKEKSQPNNFEQGQKISSTQLSKVTSQNGQLQPNQVFSSKQNYNNNYRRFLDSDVKELGYQLGLQRAKFTNENNHTESIKDLYRQIRAELIQLRESDGQAEFRQRELKELGTLVQNQIWTLQNPTNCSAPQKVMVCSIGSECGFGCQIRHVAFCLLMAYGGNKTLILKSRGWHYESKGWDHVFMPLSTTCQIENFDTTDLDTKTGLSFAKNMIDLFTMIPRNIRSRLERVHDEPHIWWVGQFMKFVLRLNPKMEAAILTPMKLDKNFARRSSAGHDSPIVGVHVRRTDKVGTEASFHSLEEYMVHVDEYFGIFEKIKSTASSRHVFIASDDPTVLPEARQSYRRPKWTILGNEGVAKSASTKRRYSSTGLLGVIRDIFTLASCDFLVCTFSSVICRIPYELMQTKDGGDYSQNFFSLDDNYYFNGGYRGNTELYVAHVQHNPRTSEEIELRVDDRIHLMGNHWNGFSKGTNQRTGKVGLFPSYKIRRFLYTTDDSLVTIHYRLPY